MADLDFSKIKLYVGNYDFWLESSQLATKLQAQSNAKKEEQIKEFRENKLVEIKFEEKRINHENSNSQLGN